MSVCPYCGFTGNGDGAKFCTECGNALPQEPVVINASAPVMTPDPEPTPSFFDPTPAAQNYAAAANESFTAATSVPVGTAPVNKTPGKAIAGLVLGIAAIVFCFVPVLGVILGILGIIFGALSRKQMKTGVGIAGIVTGAVGIFLNIVISIFACIALTAVVNEVDWDNIDFDDLDGMEFTYDDDGSGDIDFTWDDDDFDVTWDSKA